MKCLLNGYFKVSNGTKAVRCIKPTCVEIYYHEELPFEKRAEDNFNNGLIKDYIVYHRNRPNQTNETPLFSLPGVLNNHQSGIDLAFEFEDNGIQIRASALIRGFYVYENEADCKNGLPIGEQKPDDCSTHIYDELYPFASIFDGICIKWIDGTKTLGKEIMAIPRKNVFNYIEDSRWSTERNKKSLDYATKKLAENQKHYEQDERPLRFYNKAFYGNNGPR